MVPRHGARSGTERESTATLRVSSLGARAWPSAQHSTVDSQERAGLKWPALSSAIPGNYRRISGLLAGEQARILPHTTILSPQSLSNRIHLPESIARDS